MIIFVKIIAVQIPSALRSRVALQVENALLRHQVEILGRRAPGRVRFSPADRIVFELFLRWCQIKANGSARTGHPALLMPQKVRATRQGQRSD